MKMKVYLYWVSDAYMPDGGSYHATLHDGMDGHDGRWRLLTSSEADFDVPAFDPRAELIESMKKEKAEVIREATKKAERLDERIQQLLALDAPAAA
jgi:hypothetical protein